MTDTDPCDHRLLRSAAHNALAGLVLTLALGAAIAEILGLGNTYILKTLAAYGLVVLVLLRFLTLHGPKIRLGPANQVTLLRGVLTALLAGFIGETSSAALGWTAFGLALITSALDGVDGRIARRLGWSSPFGARFDMELDALLVAVLAVLLWTLERAGIWVLAAGALRYLFVTAGLLWPKLSQPLPASRRRQTVCVVQVLTLTLALVPVLPPTWAKALVALGLGLLCYSFAVDTLWLIRQNEPVAPASIDARQRSTLDSSSRRLSPWLKLAAGLLLLNSALSFHGHWSSLWVGLRWELSPEVAVLILVLSLSTRIWGSPTSQQIKLMALILSLLVLVRYAQVISVGLYGRPINLFWDLRYLPQVIPMLVQSAPWHLLLGLPIAFMALLALIYRILRWALVQVIKIQSETSGRQILGALAAVAILIYVSGLASPRLNWERWFSQPVTLALAEQASFALKALGAIPQALPPSPPMHSDLGQVLGAHVVIVFAESYGAVTFDRPDLAAALAPARTDLAAALSQTGREAVSAFVRSPTFGGGSWLAHASLLSGVEVRDGSDYALLLTQPRETLVHHFNRAGYRTLGVMPGLRLAWPEGAFYGYDEILDARGLNYRGPDLGWWRIPDQFSLARLDATELTKGEPQPRLVVFPTINSHVPFKPTPPYQPDWERMLRSDPFDAGSLQGAMTQGANLTNLKPAYADSIAYLFRVLAGWLRHRPDLDLVLLVLGDHQPLAAVSGGSGWEVPVHLISWRGALQQKLLAEGFVPGLTPQRPVIGSMSDLTSILLRAFDSKTQAGDTPR